MTALARWRALGTTAEVVVTDDAALAEAAAVVQDVLERVDEACSRFRDDSELSRLNAAGGRPFRVGAVLLDAIDDALWAACATGGAVDPTIGAALVAVGYDRDFAEIRHATERNRPRPPRLVPAGGWRDVEVDRAAGTVTLPRGVRLDLGATAKAGAADRAAAAAAAVAPAGLLVSLGGDVAVAGPAPAAGWPVGISDGHRDGVPAATIAIAAGGLATSSTTQRRWRRDGRAMHHIIDPRTGLPAETEWRTVTVAAATCVAANAASTAAIVLGTAALPRLRAGGLHARLVAVAGRVETTGGWPAAAEAA